MKTYHIHSVKYSLFMNFVLKASGFIFPLITYPYVLRVLQSDGNGKVAFVSAVSGYFVMLSSLGIPAYGIKACAKVRDNQEELSKTVQEILLIHAVSTVIVLVIYFSCVFCIKEFAEEKTLFFIFSVNIFLNAIGLQWFYQALEQYDYITVRSVIFKIISMILLFLLVRDSSDYVIYGMISVLALAGSNVLNFIRIFKFISFQRFQKYDLKKHLKPIFVLFAHSVAASVYTGLDVIMLGVLCSRTEVGLYDAALKIKSILTAFISSFNEVLMPRMSYYTKKGNTDAFLNLLKVSMRIAAGVTLPLVFYFSVFSRQCVLFLGGSGYEKAAPMMCLLTAALLPVALAGVMASQVLIPVNMEVRNLQAVLAGAGTDLILNIILIPVCGGVGAAFSTLVTEIVVFGFCYYYSREYVKGLLEKRIIGIYLFSSIISLLVSIIVRNTFMYFFHAETEIIILMLLAVTFTSFGMVYIILLLLFKDSIVLQIISRLKEMLHTL